MSCNVPADFSVACQYVRDHCADSLPGLINYYEFVYCDLKPTAPVLPAFILFVWLLLLFNFLGTVASDHFGPNVASLAKLLNIPPDVAGVTLVALGNAANDIVGNLISFRENGGAQLAVGEIIGQGLFLNCVVVGTIAIMNRNDIRLAKGAVLRDVSFYFVGLVVVSLVVLFGVVYWYQGLILLLTYLCYATTLLIMTNRILGGKVQNVWGTMTSVFSAPEVGTTSASAMPSGQSFPTIRVESVDMQDDEVQRMDVVSSRSSSPYKPDDLLQVPSPPHPTTPRPSENSRHSRSISHPLPFEQAPFEQIQPQLSIPIMRSSSYGGQSGISQLTQTLDRKQLPVNLRDYVPEESSGQLTPAVHTTLNRQTTIDASQDQNSSLISLRYRESLSRHQVQYSMSTAIELWSALNNLAQEPDQDIPLYNDQVAPQVFSLGVSRSISPVPHVTRSSSKSHSDQVSVYRSPTSKSQDPEKSDFELISVLPLLDYCSICLKSHENMQGLHYHIHNYHLFPVLSSWNIVGSFGKFLEIVNFIPYFVFGLSVPVVALMDDDQSFNQNVSTMSRSAVSQSPTSPNPQVRRRSKSPQPIAQLNQPSSGRDLRRSKQTNYFELEEAQRSVTPDPNAADINQYVSNLSIQKSDFQCQYGRIMQIPWKHRYLAVFQVFVAPVLCSVGLSFYDDVVFSTGSYQFRAWLLCLIIGLFLSSFVAYFAVKGYRVIKVCRMVNIGQVCDNAQCHFCMPNRSRTLSQKIQRVFSLSTYKYSETYPLLCIFGFVSGFMWIYLISAEVVGILYILGTVMGASNSILGLTLFAFGNCVNDFATNLTIARLFFPQMGIGACYGAPLLNILITIGIASFLPLKVPGQQLTVRYTPILITSVASLYVVVLSNLLYVGYWKKFTLSRNYGFVLIGWWLLTVAICIALEATK